MSRGPLAFTLAALIALTTMAWAQDAREAQKSPKAHRADHEKAVFEVDKTDSLLRTWGRFIIFAHNKSEDQPRAAVGRLRLYSESGEACGESPIFVEIPARQSCTTFVSVKQTKPWCTYSIELDKVYDSKTLLDSGF